MILIPVVVVFSFLFGWQAAHLTGGSTGSAGDRSSINGLSTPLTTAGERTHNGVSLGLFWEVWDILQQHYVEPKNLDVQNMVYGAIKGMVDSLNDPYTVFMDPNESHEFRNSLDGTLEGIGAELTVKDKALTIMSVIKGSPAEAKGLVSDDIILKINDEVTSDMTVYQAVTKIRGARGTSVRLLIFRSGVSEPFEVEIVRDTIRFDRVELEDKGKGIYYIGLHQFTDTTTTELNDVVSKLVLKQPRGIILDLRNNGGGYLEVAVDVLSEFLSGQRTAVIIRERNGSKEDQKLTNGKARLDKVPLVVLVNHGSASASEIVAGALQDHKRATVLGEQTYGKGSVQEVEPLQDNASLRYTVALWFTPLARSINKEGIVPDRVVKIDESDVKKGRDPQIDAAIQYLKGVR